MSLFLTLAGGVAFEVCAQERTEMMNLCLSHSISIRDVRYGEDGSLGFSCTLQTAKRLLRLTRECGLCPRIVSYYGIPALLWRHRHRAGLFLGGTLIILMLVLSGRFVWDVRVTGNTNMTVSEVQAELKACGFGIGSYIPNVRTVELENRILLASDRISWISLHMDGTVASVQIIERVPIPEQAPKTPANLVARVDGQIEHVELYRGNCVVKVGQAVKEGELLVSGLYDNPNGNYRYTRAAGRVLARTDRSFTVEIPLAFEKKVYGDAKCGEIVLNFFDFSLKIFKKAGNEDIACDIIKKEKGWDLFGAGALPVGITVEERLPYTVETDTRTYEEATTLAYAELDRLLSGLASEAQLLEKKILPRLTDTALILECSVVCVEDIARQVEFEIIESP